MVLAVRDHNSQCNSCFSKKFIIYILTSCLTKATSKMASFCRIQWLSMGCNNKTLPAHCVGHAVFTTDTRYDRSSSLECRVTKPWHPLSWHLVQVGSTGRTWKNYGNPIALPLTSKHPMRGNLHEAHTESTLSSLGVRELHQNQPVNHQADLFIGWAWTPELRWRNRDKFSGPGPKAPSESLLSWERRCESRLTLLGIGLGREATGLHLE